MTQVTPLRALILTARPKTLSAALVPVVVATALVAAEHAQPVWWISICAVLSAICIQVGTNFANDALDFWKGADKETRLGEARASQSGWFQPRTVLAMAFAFFALAALLGLPLVMEGGWPVFWIGVISLLMGYAYTGGPFPLAYLGLGDVFVLIFFGLVAVGGVYFLQTKELSTGALVAGAQVGLLATVLIAINNLRDLEQDRQVNKKTLAVRLGPRRGRFEVLFLVGAAFALNFYWWWRGEWLAALLPLLVSPVAIGLLWSLLTTSASREYNRLLAKAALVHVLFGLLFSAGLVLI